MQKVLQIILLAMLGIAFISCESKTSYNKGYEEGKRDGYNRGYEEGRQQGYNEGYDEGHDEGYDEGYYEGRNSVMFYNF